MNRWPLWCFVKIKKFLTKGYRTPIDEREFEARKLAIKLINSKSSSLRFCPLTAKRFILNPSYGVSVIISNGCIEFFDSSLHTINLCGKNYEFIINAFDAAASKDRELLEKKIKSTIQHSFFDLVEYVNQFS